MSVHSSLQHPAACSNAWARDCRSHCSCRPLHAGSRSLQSAALRSPVPGPGNTPVWDTSEAGWLQHCSTHMTRCRLQYRAGTEHAETGNQRGMNMKITAIKMQFLWWNFFRRGLIQFVRRHWSMTHEKNLQKLYSTDTNNFTNWLQICESSSQVDWDAPPALLTNIKVLKWLSSESLFR